MIFIKNAKFILTPDLIKEKSILIDGNNIVSFEDKDKSDIVIDAKDKVILPGFINYHNHSPMSILRGFADDMPLKDWLEKKIWPLEAKLNKNDIYYGSVLACLEMIKNGTTTFYDMYYFGDEIAKACENSGIKGNLSWPILNKEISTQEGDPLANAENFVKKWKANELVTPMVGPHAIYTCSSETLQKARELADRYKTTYHIHLSETKRELDDCLKNNKMRPVEYLDSLGVLKNAIAAHCVWVDENEIKILAKNNVIVAHCPISNLKLASGIAPVNKMINNNVNVKLGTDGPTSNNNLDMFEEMKFASLLQKQITNDPSVLPARKILEMAVGKIEIRGKADLILVDLKKPHLRPVHDIYSHLAYSANGSDVNTTICNGKILMQNRKVLTLKEDEILEKVEKIKEDLIHRQ